MHLQFEFKKNLKVICFAVMGLFILGGYAYISTEQEEVINVKTFLSKDGIHPGKTVKVAFFIEIHPDWHINAHELTDEFLIPSDLTFEENENLEVLKYYYPEPKLGKFDYSDSELQIYEDEAIFGALIKVSDKLALGQHKLKAKLRYQACNHRSCLPPKTLNFELELGVVSPCQETKDIHQDIFSKLDFEKDNTL